MKMESSGQFQTGDGSFAKQHVKGRMGRNTLRQYIIRSNIIL